MSTNRVPVPLGRIAMPPMRLMPAPEVVPLTWATCLRPAMGLGSVAAGMGFSQGLTRSPCGGLLRVG
jgi:hypothetical protein